MSRANISVEMNSKEAKLWQGMQKLITQQGTMENKFKQTGKAARGVGTEMKQAGTHGTKAFGPSAVGQLAQFAGGFVGIQKAIGLATKLLNGMEQAGVDAAAKAKESIMGLGPLAQLTGVDPVKHKALLAEAHEAYGSGVGKSLTEVGDTWYNLWAAGMTKKERDLFSEMAGTGYLKTAETGPLGAAASGFVESMGRKEVGTLQDMMNKGIVGAAGTPVSPAAFLSAAIKPAGVASALGIRDEELMAFLSVSTKARGTTALKPASYIDAFLTAIAKNPEFEGRGLSLKEIGKTIEAKGLGRGELELLVGGSQGVKAFDDLRRGNMEAYGEMVTKLDQAAAQNPLPEQLKMSARDPSLKAAMAAIAAEHQEELSRMQLGTERNMFDRMMNQYAVQRRKEGGPLAEWDIGIERASSELLAWGTSPRAVVQSFGTEVKDPQFRADRREMLGPEVGIGEGLRSTRHAPRSATMSPELMRSLTQDIRDAVLEGLEALKDGARGPTLVPPNVDR